METIEKKEEILYNRYENMCIALYSYRSGHLEFTELLEKFEEIVNSSPSQAQPSNTSDKQQSD